ncbi:3-hexulose-6-phosphate synthase [Enterococcus pallens]|uniref:3-hexulose-6-phosphate synthase n=1 Tax=Enterococcus pallens ATCC BAA-351 TaxID=1158607 RepID=R2T5Q2_9ENTE|nr:3-hexulose-6-phosphate synthase [Enterococcus pallens]EOH95574.1 3-hexulose-6-phosphate synthase [Enterococcus pallens ATCC BAA-351]EOU21289.1 3-hexulose-6-phosphate synthase [Enterococcus pallens ATCC BAA-351]OJG78823.1 3-hexulose-6-phosphate synthase [Enterococcus pallens]
MKIQLAIDELSLSETLNILDEIVPFIDIIEVGTPFMIDAGREAVRRIKEKYPHKEVLCDAKIMDAGAYESELVFEAKADYVTVLGLTDDSTIRGCVEVAKKYGKKVLVDMICVGNLEKRIPEIEALGVDIIAVHTGADLQKQGRTPLEDLIEMKKHVKKCQIAVAGGINLSTIDSYIKESPDIVIVGSGILNDAQPREVAEGIFRKINGVK